MSVATATNLRYGLSSNLLVELGGSEKTRLPDFFANDFDWSSRGKIQVGQGRSIPTHCTYVITACVIYPTRLAQVVPPVAERIIVELYDDKCPLAVENFMALCTGEKGKCKNCPNNLHYKGARFHRVVKDFICQTGDFVMANGTGGESIWNKKFKDEPKGLKLKHDAMGVLSMCNSGKNSNSSQFFFTFKPCKQCDGKHVVFGKIVRGMEVLEMINAGTAGEVHHAPCTMHHAPYAIRHTTYPILPHHIPYTILTHYALHTIHHSLHTVHYAVAATVGDGVPAVEVSGLQVQ
jgi:cyclophilin family peptidyl-prolyl cis-trans isomerase